MAHSQKNTNAVVKYESFRQFYPYYLHEHRNKINRILHFIGTFISHLFLVYFLWSGKYSYIPLSVVPGYAFAWVGHFVFEKNKPATFQHPFYSFMGDIKLFYSILAGKAHFWQAEAKDVEWCNLFKVLHGPL